MEENGISSAEVASAAIELALTTDRETERDKRAGFAQKGMRTAAVDFGGEFIPSINKIIERTVVAARREGVTDGSHLEEGAVAGAVLECIDKMLPKAGTVILEPLMHLEILTPEDTVGEISMYLQPRRAIISDIETLGSMKKVICQVPLAEMFGFGKA